MKKDKKDTTVYVADFETSVYPGQEETEVWAAAIVKLNTENVHVFNSIDEFFDYIYTLPGDIDVYFHNLKFDGNFLITYLLQNGWKYSLKIIDTEMEESENIRYNTISKMKNKEIVPLISDRGLWYSITIKQNNRIITFKDSYKLLPFSVETLGKDFDLKHKKSCIEYVGERHAGGEITEEEKGYISNDVLVVKEALESAFELGMNSLTIGACCLSDFKKNSEYNLKDILFNLKYIDKKSKYNKFELVSDEFKNVDEYIRRSYRGGWCYVKEDRAKEIIHDGCTADVNSLYPSMMESESGNIYPAGAPHFWKGDIPEEIKNDSSKYYFVRIKTAFVLKPGYLPFIQIPYDCHYPIHEMLKSSELKNPLTGKHSFYYKKDDGTSELYRPELTLTMTDYKLFKEHYDLVEEEVLDGCYFDTVSYLFDNYIHKWQEVKQTSTGAKRQQAKLMLNNLYGKMAAKDDSSFKIPYLDDEGVLHFHCVEAHDRAPGFIAIGSAITSYARNFTIRAAQKNYEHFIYADTDSMHLDCKPDEIKGIKIDPVHFNCWKIEKEWKTGYFVRPKTYIEDDEIKCAGMPTYCKNLLLTSLKHEEPDFEKCSENEKRFYYDEDKQKIYRTLKDFDVGLSVPGKLVPRNIAGGVILQEVDFTLNKI